MTVPTDPTAVAPASNDAAAPPALPAAPAALAPPTAAPIAAPSVPSAPAPAPAPGVPAAPPKRVLNPHAAAAQPQPPPPHPAETALAEERAANATYAAAALASLPTDAMRKTVTDSVGTDPKAQLKMIAAMQSNGLASMPLIGGQANTAPSGTQTPVAGASADPDILAAQQLAELAKDPRRALATSRFRQQNEAAIKRGVAKLASKTTP